MPGWGLRVPPRLDFGKISQTQSHRLALQGIGLAKDNSLPPRSVSAEPTLEPRTPLSLQATRQDRTSLRYHAFDTVFRLYMEVENETGQLILFELN